MEDTSNNDLVARSYADPDGAIKAFVASLGETPLPDDILKQVIGQMGLVEKLAVEPKFAAKTSQGAIVAPFRYVIRNDRIVTFGSFLDALKGVAALVVGILGVQSPASVPQGTKGIIDGVVALYNCFRGAIDRGERLAPDDFLVVATLKSMGPATAAEIAHALAGTADVPAMGADQVTQILSKYLETSENENGFTQLEDTIWHLVKV